MKKKGMAAVALAATMVAPGALSAASLVSPSVFMAAEAETEVKEVKVDFKINGLPADAKGSLKIEFTEKDNAEKKYVWDSVENKDKEFKLPVGKVYLVKIAGTPEGYKAEAKETTLDIKADATACNIEVTVVKNDETAKPDPKPETATKRKLEVQHLDETGKAVASGKVEIVEKDKAGSVATIDFSQPNKNVVELEVGKTYLVNFTTKPEGYTVEKDSSEIKIEPNAEGKTENQILVLKSKKNDSAKPEDPSAVEKLLVLQHIDKATNKEIKSGEVSILEKGMDEAKAQKYDFSKEDNNVKVTNGKTYVIKFTKTANGYTPLSQEQELKVEFSPTDGADTYLAKIYSNPLVVNQGGNNGGTTNNNGGTTNNGGVANNNGSSTGLPKTGVVASSIGIAAVGAVGSGIGILRKRR